ncbi:restriction endonuclease subunit S, partial [Vibrio harveyi]|uniref:restriction endonuclease subunit S n=1 Tax=Vibrio harveyi TaxID=669 RepID=UPI001603F6C9
MGSEITYRKLKDCAVWYSGGTPRKSNAEYWNGTIPWISAKSLHDTFICDSEDKVTELGAQNGTRTVPEGTILFVVRGMSLKNEFRVGLTTDTVTFNQDLKALLPVEGIDSHYLLYFLKSKAKDILSLVEEAGHGTGVLPTAVLQELDVPVPPLQQQKLVAKVILNFDEKIKINRQINQTLEQMAQTLFKSWFVDFDPVIDNALDVGNPIPEVFETRVERRKAVRESADFKPLPDDVRQLFPSEFEESELG